jgi:hypothetical protein
VHYASLLDSRYTFEFLPQDVDPGKPEPVLDLSEELGIAGRMFKGREGEDGVKVRSIGLELTVKTLAVDNTPYPEKPAGETWYRSIAGVSLRVVADYPSSTDGSDITNFAVNSDQIFVLRPDPAHAGRFLVVRQTDQAPIHKKAEGGAATEGTSWGSVKSLWR